MGTRGLLGFVTRKGKKGTDNHFDSYPTGLGWEIMQWIKSLSEEQIQQMAERVENIQWYFHPRSLQHNVSDFSIGSILSRKPQKTSSVAILQLASRNAP